ncbi:MAG: hypothetical protein HY747_02030 [Elusimicrobia bacterium]|nr:hypothetical protein [Elusimicrobiota bacterium]
MRISLLLRREPFGRIVEETLSQFLSSRTATPHRVRWYDANPGLRAIRKDGFEPWLCNKYLNAIFSSEAKQNIFRPARQEFMRSPFWWRCLAQKLYVEAATHRYLGGWLAQSALGIAPAVGYSGHVLITGGNNHLRMFDMADGRVYVIAKSGFPRFFYERELTMRKETAGLTVPQIIAADPGGLWCLIFRSGIP